VIVNHALLDELKEQLEGTLYHDKMMRSLYATDASIYREMPMAVAIPQNIDDLKQIISFANKNSIGIIPRTAGTSLAGQCVGNGMVVDVSVNFTKILEVNQEQAYVRVQPGVVRDELNQFLAPYGLYFGPNTSTANRAMIGGMVGNNSCGSYSIVYGTTRDHVQELHAILYDGSEVVFGEIDQTEFEAKCALENAEGKIYRQIRDGLMDADRRALIEKEYPAAAIHRRNTGYAVDVLMHSKPFNPQGPAFNMCKLICGSEGSLCFITEIKLHVDPLPPKEQLLICAHFNSIHDAMLAVLEILPHKPRAVELMDHHILDCTKDHIEFSKYRFFVEGEPKAILVLELGDDDVTRLEQRSDALLSALKEKTKATAWPKVYGATDIRKVWKLREAG
jgi:FAD/FMN-containing dehydrogenase